MPEFDDEWYEQWKRNMEERGNVILALGIRPTAQDDEKAVLEMPMGPNVRQGTGVFAAGALMQLADVGATMVCQRAAGSTRENPKPFPLSIQISVNLLRNTDKGKAISESRIVHRGRTMTVVESRVHDDNGRLLCIVTSTHIAPGA
jgi:uncharacterized protein (TIGR00369 family)